MRLLGKEESLYNDGVISFNISTIDSIHETQELTLSEKGDVNCLIVGQHGSGLSSLLNIITANLVVTYRRDDIKLVLTGGESSDLNIFTTEDSKKRLSSIGKDIDCCFDKDVKSIINKFAEISQECQNRLVLISDKSAKTMSNYNKLAALSDDPKFVRLIPIVLICDDLESVLKDLSNEDSNTLWEHLHIIIMFGRCTGIHIIATATSFSGFTGVYENLYNHCSLKICKCNGYACMCNLDCIDKSKCTKIDVGYIPYEVLIDNIICSQLCE